MIEKLSSQSQSSLLSLWWYRDRDIDIFFVLVECNKSRLGILPFFSLPPFCLFCYHCSVSLYFAKYNCTFRSSVLFSFALLQLFLQFIGEFLLMCRVCCEMQKMSKLPTVYPRITLRVGFISWINFLYSWQVTGTRDPPENLHGYPGAWNTRNWHP